MAEYLIKNGENIRESINKILSESNDCIINIEPGRYFIDDTLEICSNRNVQINALGEVIFDGGIILKNSDVKDYKGDIKCIDLKSYGVKIGEYGNRGLARSYINAPNELFIDGKAYIVSRYPKHENITFIDGDIIDSGSNPRSKEFDLRPATIRCRDSRIKKWANAKDAYIGGLPIQSWADDTIKIDKIDVENQTITTTQPHLYSFGVTGHSSWYITNLLEELTEPGEYYIDTKKQILYFIPINDISNSLIQVSNLDKVMIACENSENIKISGITFENSRNSGIYIEGGEKVNVKDCIFRNLGILAVQIGQGAESQPHGLCTGHIEDDEGRAEGVPVPKPISREMGSWYQYIYEFKAWDNNAGKNHLIEGCKIYNMGAGGMLLSGGNRKKLIPGNNTIYNCEFYEVNRLDKTYKAAVNLMGVGNKISHCEIHDLSGMAIYMHGNDHIIEYNKIHHVLKLVSDAGAIYMGRDMSEVGNIIRYNFIYSIHNAHKTGLGTCAVYFDDWSIYNMVYGNYFYDIVSDGKFFFSTIYHTCGGLTSIGNNIFIDCFPGLNPNTKSNANLHMHTDKLSIRRVHTTDENDIHGVDVTSEVYKERYPYLYKTYTEDYNPGTKFWHNRVYVNQYNDFVDAKNLNFKFIDDAEHLKSNMPEYKITDDVFGVYNEVVEIKNVDFENIGLVK